MSNLTKPPILDDTGQDILSALADIKRNLPQGGGSNGYAPTDATETALADDDKMPFYDTSASGKRNSTWANIKAKLKAYFDTIYAKNLYYDDLYEPSQYNTNTHKFWGRGLFNCSLESAPNKFTDFADAIVTATNDHANTIAKLRVELTLAEFNALTPAEQDDPEIVYYITDKPSLGYPVQDDGTATNLADGALQTGRTIENYINKSLRTSNATGVITKLISGGTLDCALCVKIGDLVIASGRIYGINPTVAASGDFFQLPAGFRPPRTTYGYGYMIMTGIAGTNALLCTINTSGKVNIAYSAGNQTGQVGFYAVFSTV